MPGELEPPPAIHLDGRALELLRVWAASGKQHVTIRTDVWKDPGAWGVFLVDLAKHIADAYVQSGGHDREEVLARLRSALEAEWSHPTDSPTGNLSK